MSVYTLILWFKTPILLVQVNKLKWRCLNHSKLNNKIQRENDIIEIVSSMGNRQYINN